MREIKFRGKTLATNEWVYGFYTVIAGYCNITPIGCGNFEYSIVIPETVGQFTGLVDKNRVEIYEGDILCYDKIANLYKGCPIEIHGIVIYKNGKYEAETKKVINKYFLDRSSIFFGIQPMDWIHLPEFHKSKIIGNIHDNPELLKTK